MGSSGDRYSRLAALRPAPGVAAGSTTRTPVVREPCEEDTLARLLGAGVCRNQYGEHLAVRNWYSTPEFSEPSTGALELLSRSRDEQHSRRMHVALGDTEKWLFLDTETTGLSGGTGTYAFLIGLAWWDAGGLQVEQLFMRDFSEEHSVLCELAARIAERPVLVTFNGKTFDWPLLENRFTLTRCIGVPKLSAHLDLLHPARALWKLRLGTVRLVDLERHVLDPIHTSWSRQHDTASSLIPQFYFDYLRGGPPEPLLGIARHNQMDLRGLAALYAKMDALLSARKEAGEHHGLDLFGLSRYLQRKGDARRAHDTCEQALGAGLPGEYRPQARRELAQMAKRRGEHERAAEMWHEISSDGQNGIHACEQLAIHYERKIKDCARALEFAELALAKVKRQRASSHNLFAGARLNRLEDGLLRRVERLKKKMQLGAAQEQLPALS